MKKTLIVVGVILVIVIALYQFFAGTYNKLVIREEQVQKSWAQVQTVYQRRIDLLDNLVSSVKEAADYEKSTLSAVTLARSNAMQVKIDPKNLTTEQMASGMYIISIKGENMNQTIKVVKE